MKKIVLKTWLLTVVLVSLIGYSATGWTENYVMDAKGAHAFIQFRVKHLGYSWLYGRFNTFTGKFSFDENAPERSTVEVNIDTRSLDSNHAERDKHLRGEDFLNVDQFPNARFVSTGVDVMASGEAIIHGNLTLRGVTKSIDLHMVEVGTGPDPWGGYRRGFEGTSSFALADFGIVRNLGAASKNVELILSAEGIRQ